MRMALWTSVRSLLPEEIRQQTDVPAMLKMQISFLLNCPECPPVVKENLIVFRKVLQTEEFHRNLERERIRDSEGGLHWITRRYH